MADNVTTQTATLATIPTATAIATDDEAGVHYQKVKLADGTSGATTPIAAGGGVEAGALRVTVASDSTGVLSVDDNGASLTVDGTVTAHAGTGPWPVTDNGGTLSVDDGGGALTVDGTVTVQDGGSTISVDDGGGSLTIDGTVSLSGTNTVQETPGTSGGLSTLHLVAAASTNATSIKAGAGQVYHITAFNVSTSPRYLKFHNTAGTPTAGSGVVRTVLIPGNSSGAGVVMDVPGGLAFSTGIAFTIVTGIADSDTGAPGSSEVVVDVGYK